MTEQEIQERNKEIAVMLGVDINFFNWDWLMEAVEFIEKLGGSYSISNKSCAISVNEPYWFGAEIVVKTNESTHKAVFIAVSDFAKLYNEGEL
jgi:hypothetical protein